MTRGVRYSDDRDRITLNVAVNEASDCWEWTGARTNGYGRVWIGAKGWRAHRLSYELFVGPIPEGLQIDHLCRNRPCVNPEHLEPVTGAENIRRAPECLATVNAALTSCRRGHEFTPENTYRAHGFRYCRACRARWQSASRNRIPSAAA